MNQRNSEKPFGFLEVIGKPAIFQALALSTNCERLSGNSSNDQLVWELLKNPQRHASVPTGKLRELVFFNESLPLKGFTLQAAANGFQRIDTKQVVKQKYLDVLTVQFYLESVLEAANINLLTEHWLEMVVSITRELKSQFEANVTNNASYIQASKTADLFSDDPRTFGLAIGHLDEHGVPPTGLVERCIELLRLTTNPQLTLAAVRPLVWFAKGEDCTVSKRLLAEVVNNRQNETHLREVAYQALFELDQAPVRTWPAFKRELSDFKFPEDIDWDFVNKFL
jgi:hypothetical protein